MKHRFIWAGVAALALAAVMACDNSTSGPSGTFTVTMKDSPFTDAKALLVTFSEISVHASGGDWKTVPFDGGGTSITCDLEQLTNALDILGATSLAEGHYTGIRLAVSSATINFENKAAAGPCAATIAPPAGTNTDVTVPSDRILLNRDFDIATGTNVTMQLDFHGDESVHETGNGKYMMTPVISIDSVK